MIVAPRISLVQFVVDGISIIMNRDEAKELQRTPRFSSTQIKPLRKASKGRSFHAQQPSPVRIIPASEYMANL